MNVVNILKTADIIEAHATQFDMGTYGPDPERLLHNCGTAACIAGWARTLDLSRTFRDTAFDIAMDLFGIDDDEAYELFVPDDLPEDTVWNQAGIDHPYRATAEDAARLLRGIAYGEFIF